MKRILSIYYSIILFAAITFFFGWITSVFSSIVVSVIVIAFRKSFYLMFITEDLIEF